MLTFWAFETPVQVIISPFMLTISSFLTQFLLIYYIHNGQKMMKVMIAELHALLTYQLEVIISTLVS